MLRLNTVDDAKSNWRREASLSWRDSEAHLQGREEQLKVDYVM
jgi:hypothetical protein